MVTADDATPPIRRRRGTRLRRDAARRGIRLPERLALVGIALVGFWPGEPWSAVQITLVAMCLLPLGVRSLLQWEDLLEVEPTLLPTREEAVARSVHALDNVDVPLAVIEAGPDGGVVREANPAMCDLLGLDPSGRFWWYLVTPADRVAVAKAITMVLGGHTRAWRGLARHLPAEPTAGAQPAEPTAGQQPAEPTAGAPTWLRLQLIALPTRRGEPARLSLHASPASAPLRVSAPAAQTPAPVTSSQALLLDRAELAARLADLLAAPRPAGSGVVVLHCEVQVGRPTTSAATAAVMTAVATRLLDTCRPDDLIARGDGDSLLVVRSGLADATAAQLLNRRLLTALAAPLAVQDAVRTVPTRLGLALSAPGSRADDLLDRAAHSARQSEPSTTTAVDP